MFAHMCLVTWFNLMLASSGIAKGGAVGASATERQGLGAPK